MKLSSSTPFLLVGLLLAPLLVAVPAAADIGATDEYPVPTAGSQPVSIVTADGPVWFAEQVGNKIGRLDVDSLGAG